MPAIRVSVAIAEQHLTPHWGFWLLVIALALSNLLWVAGSARLSFAAWVSPAALGLPVAVLLMLAFRHQRQGNFDPLLSGMFRVMMFMIFAMAANMSMQSLNCLLMSLGLPLADPVLAAADRRLGFDWNTYAQWVASHDGLREGLRFAYSGMVYKLVPVLVAAMVFFRREDRIDELAFLCLAAPLVCIGIAALLPAEAAWVTVASKQTVDAFGGVPYPGWLETFLMLRSGEPVTIDPSVMGGLATFPSFHTCLGLILLWCCRGHWLSFSAGAAGGLAIIASTPVYGGHYLVDVLAGVGLMAVLVLAWHRPWRAAD